MNVQERESYWFNLLEAHKRSGQTKKAWCEANGVNVKSLYRWSGKLVDRIIPATVTHTQNVRINNNIREPHRFLLAQVSGDAYKDSCISIRIGKAAIDVGDDFSKETLINVVQIVSEIC